MHPVRQTGTSAAPCEKYGLKAIEKHPLGMQADAIPCLAHWDQENCKVVISPSLRRSASQRMVGRSASIGDVTCCNKVGSTSKDAERPMRSVPTRSMGTRTLQFSCGGSGHRRIVTAGRRNV